MPPPRLNELACPSCGDQNWVMDSDYRGTDGIMLPYERREYGCRNCGNKGIGWKLIQQSPPAFFLQPHDIYPMSRGEFERWVSILKANFPDHPRLTELGKTFFPRLP